MIYLDCETVGLTGPLCTIQYAIDDGPVRVHEVFYEPIRSTLSLIEMFVEHPEGICGFNLVFDWFHLQRGWCVLKLLGEKAGFKYEPRPKGWMTMLQPSVWGPCLKPHTALDLMLYARKGPMQSLMERDDIRIKRVPKVLAGPLAEELTRTVVLPDIYFARSARGCTWKVEEEPDDVEFPDLCLNFGAAGGLKPLARHLLGADALDLPLPDSMDPGDKKFAWNPFHPHAEDLIIQHAAWWHASDLAKRYAREDVEHTRNLHLHWGKPASGDVDSLLAIAVACIRHRGYSVDQSVIQRLTGEATELMNSAPRAPERVLKELHALLSEPERAVIDNTRAETLEAVAKLGGSAGQFCTKVINARSAEKQRDICEKLAITGRFHPDAKVIGALSGRMSGASGLSIHGFPRDPLCVGVDANGASVYGTPLRSAITFSDEGFAEHNEGGDFDGFEVTIADAVYQDPVLRAELQQNLKIHGLFGAEMYQLSYAIVKNSADEHARVKDQGWDGDIYNPSKHGYLAWIYGAQAEKIASTMKLTVEETERGLEAFTKKYTTLAAGRRKDEMAFCSMRQPGGIGTRVVWHEPAEYVESLFGFKRYFTLENRICKALYELAKQPPESLKGIRDRVLRQAHKGTQTASGAVQSALYAAAFAMQARNMRSAGNHRIQSTGAYITKDLQLSIWHHQPVGIHPYVVRPMNVHDEVPTATAVSLSDTAHACVERNRSVVPLLRFDKSKGWAVGWKNWKELK